MKNFGIALVAATLVLMASWAMAGPGSGWGGRGMGLGCDGPAAQALNLTPEQSQKIQELRQSRYDEMAALREEMAEKRAELQMLWAAPEPDQAQILAKQRELLELRGLFQEKATQHQFALRGILTPEQLAKMPGKGFGMGGGRDCGKGPGMGGRMQGRW
ncbi:MAG: Spy/CpxP family protein refolding chaperone [Desulfobacterales bacterium]|jgi:Spy/CpxP family protein refolding chaperone|nr:Spy/CpxP family protein refolding chaperone [Desulfobacterales bacterium]